MMQLLLYQINYPRFWTWRVWGLDRVSVQSFSCFADDFTMAFHSFGAVNDQCGVTSWAVQETGMLLSLSCDSGMTAWLKHKYN